MSKLPAAARMQASIIAVVKDRTSKPEKNLSAIFITMAITISLTKKDNNPRVSKFRGNRNKKPIVAFKIPITRATKTAVPKLFIFTEGIIFAANNKTPAFKSNCNIQFMVVFLELNNVRFYYNGGMSSCTLKTSSSTKQAA